MNPHTGPARIAESVRPKWELERNVTCVVCPVCGFTFDACHVDTKAPTYSCPMCGGVGDPPDEVCGWCGQIGPNHHYASCFMGTHSDGSDV